MDTMNCCLTLTCISQLTKNRSKGPANRRLPTHRLSPLSPPHPSSDSLVNEGGGEGGEREGEKREGGEREGGGEGEMNEDVDGLGVPWVRRHRKSPRRERKRKVCCLRMSYVQFPLIPESLSPVSKVPRQTTSPQSPVSGGSP